MSGLAEAPPGIGWIDALSRRLGHAVSWLTLAMVLVTCAIVLLRYAFDVGRIWLQESVTWMHAAVFMLAAAYTLRHDDHVRVDVLQRRFSPRARALLELGGVALFLLPFAAFLLWSSYGYALDAWAVREGSREAGGLPGLWLLKALIPLTAALLVLQGVSDAVRAWRRFIAAAGRGG